MIHAKYLYLGLYVGTFLSDARAIASCPVVVPATLLDSLVGVKDSDIFAALSPSSGGLDSAVQTHIQRRNKYDQYEFPQPRSIGLRNTDTIVIQDHTSQNKQKKMNCTTPPKFLYSIRSHTNNIKIGTCSKTGETLDDPSIHYDEKNNLLYSNSYRYQFNHQNHMLFDSISILKNGQTISVAEDSDLLIRVDIRNFFSFSFTKSDILSRMRHHELFPQSALASLGFYLKVLFFKLEMSLTTDVAFYDSSANIPMIITLPYSGRKYLHRKSGVLYSWLIKRDSGTYSTSTNMKLFSPSYLTNDLTAHTKRGLENCEADLCKYTISYNIDERTFSLHFILKRSLVERGFYPSLVTNSTLHSDDMKWPHPTDQKTPRSGLYFEVSDLDEGEHKWDFWLELSDDSSGKSPPCPRDFTVQRIAN